MYVIRWRLFTSKSPPTNSQFIFFILRYGRLYITKRYMVQAIHLLLVSPSWRDNFTIFCSSITTIRLSGYETWDTNMNFLNVIFLLHLFCYRKKVHVKRSSCPRGRLCCIRWKGYSFQRKMKIASDHVNDNSQHTTKSRMPWLVLPTKVDKKRKFVDLRIFSCGRYA